MTRANQPNIIVMGAGVAGLAAARRLIQAGAHVRVLEKNAYVGGRVYTEAVDGVQIDAGAQFIANFYNSTMDLIGELGLSKDLIPIQGGAAIWRGGRIHKIWTNWRLMSTQLVPTRSKITLMRTLVPL